MASKSTTSAGVSIALTGWPISAAGVGSSRHGMVERAAPVMRSVGFEGVDIS